MDQESVEKLSRESEAIWDRNAEAWDSRIGGGGGFQTVLIHPTVDALLDLKEGEYVLDIACGNGVYSRHMAAQGARVVAVDFSMRLLEYAAARESEHNYQIEYRQVDATDESQLLSLGERQYDAAVCNMALMDIPALEPLARALPKLIKPTGRFVFSIMHPCFNTSGSNFLVEQTGREYEEITYAMKIVQYLGLGPTKGLAIADQPELQYYFHRPLHALFHPFFTNGFAIDALEEPEYDQPTKNPLGWGNFPKIPPVLCVRMRPMAGG